MHVAVATGQEEVVRELLQMGASVHIRDAAGLTPLGLALSRRLVTIAKLISKAGARIEHDDFQLQSLFLRHIAEGHEDLVQCQLECGQDPIHAILGCLSPMDVVHATKVQIFVLLIN